MLKVIELIKQSPSWRKILSAEPYNLTIKDDCEFTILKYSQIHSDMSLEIVRECRGLIIDKELNPVCVPFFKFANYGEPYADIIDWSTACIQEKLDGSLIKVWNYNGKWIVSTNNTIFAEKAMLFAKGEADCVYKNYAELFRAAANKTQLDFCKLNPRYTYMFELTSPYNRIVVPHKEIEITHIGTRDNDTLQEIDADSGIKKPKVYQFNNIDDLISMASTLKYWDEGYVVCDANYNRIKVKSPAYVAIHHLVGTLSDKRIIELIRKNEVEEFLIYFPEYKSYVDKLLNMIASFELCIAQILEEQINGFHFETRKDFALMATKTKFPAFLFAYYDGKVKNAIEWLWGMENDKVLQQLEKIIDKPGHI
ncbi:MAG: hypothetical protein FWD05_14015 [Oscillospiraceae bacterium]|nr:hypothetical protein [Oscillospiraceae bacterium]